MATTESNADLNDSRLKHLNSERIKRLFIDLESMLALLDEPNHQPVLIPAAFRLESPAAGPVVDENPACPFLKTAWDQTVRYDFPNDENYCYKKGKGFMVSMAQQKHICLTERYIKCLMCTEEKRRSLLDGLLRRFFA